jgi:hypothetical protein
VQLSLEVQNIVCIFALWMSLRRVVFTSLKGSDDERPAPRLLLTRQIDMRTPAGRPQDPMGWLELRPFF